MKTDKRVLVELESDLADCVRMEEVAALVMPDGTDEHLMFAVLQNVELLKRLKSRFYELWDGTERSEP